jgi:hypothetical protein
MKRELFAPRDELAANEILRPRTRLIAAKVLNVKEVTPLSRW